MRHGIEDICHASLFPEARVASGLHRQLSSCLQDLNKMLNFDDRLLEEVYDLWSVMAVQFPMSRGFPY